LLQLQSGADRRVSCVLVSCCCWLALRLYCCAATAVARARTPAGYTYGQPVEVHDLRMYVHRDTRPDGSEGGALSGAEMLALATAPTPQLDEEYKCLAIESPKMIDTSWQDDMGHDCVWFRDHAEVLPALCELEAAKTNCPTACQTRQECFNDAPDPPVYKVWTRTRWEGLKRGNAGSICLGSHLTKEAVVQDCKAWVAAGGTRDNSDEMAAWLESIDPSLGRKGVSRVNVTVWQCGVHVMLVRCWCDVSVMVV